MLKKIGYSAGDFGISIAYFVVGFFFMYYLTDIVGISPLLAGTIILIGKVWEAISNPLVGILNDRTRSRFGKKRIFIFAGAIPFAISFMLLWLIPNSFNEPVRFFLALAAFLLYSTAYSVVSVPYMALVPIMTRDYDERTQITGIRAVFSTVGIILGGASALLISSFTDETLGLRTMAIGFGIFTALSLLIAARSVKGVEANNKQNQDTVPARFKQYITIARSRHFLILLIFKFLGAIATGCLMAAIPYFAKNILVDTGISTYGVAIYTITSALLIPVWYKLTNRFDKRRLLLIANSLGAILLLAMGIFLNASSTFWFFIGCGLLGIIMSSYLLIPYSLVPDVVDFYRHETGERHESVYFGLWMTVHQLGIATAGFILGAFLDLLGYAGNAEVQTGSALMAVRLAFGLIPGLFLVFAAIVLQKYGITRAVYQKIQSELKRSPEKTSS